MILSIMIDIFRSKDELMALVIYDPEGIMKQACIVGLEMDDPIA